MQSSITVETKHNLKLSEDGMAVLTHLAKRAKMTPEDYATKVLADFLSGALSQMTEAQLSEMLVSRAA